MRLLMASIGVAVLLLAGSGTALAQDSVADLIKEIDLLKREIDLLKRENELLKSENAALKKGGAASASAEGEAVTRVLHDNVEYVYQGMIRSGANVFVTVLAVSKKGDQQGPNGQMYLIDDEGEKYGGMPAGGFGLRPSLREGVPVKLTWRFGPNPITGKSTAPSPMIRRFALLTIDTQVAGMDTIDFRNVPAVLSKTKAK